MALQYGREAKVSDWIDSMTSDCPRKQPSNISDKCTATSRCQSEMMLSNAAEAAVH